MQVLSALVVDDSKVMRKATMKAVLQAGLAQFSFVEAEDGADALDKYRNGRFDIMFVDWNMPNLNGFDFVQKVRSEEKGSAVQIVMVTSEQKISKINQALERGGANAYICKPISPEDVEVKLTKVLERLKNRKKKPVKQQGWIKKLFG